MSERRSAEIIKKDILTHLEKVMDPELDMDIINLGLVYEIELDNDNNCNVQMTLTTMGCPLTGVLSELVEDALKPVQEIKKVTVQFIWSPAWSIERMSRYAKMALGVH
ncbi:metal-sulfur cluster assembly factor [Dellaglioa sp. P0083]|uniref:metal-sulfur cluster assembly factor n=1 Tax=Dellaglioa kimchii TaxID=3344667 RepID=UPI0038D460AD